MTELRSGVKRTVKDVRNDPFVVLDALIVALALIFLLSLAFGIRVA